MLSNVPKAPLILIVGYLACSLVIIGVLVISLTLSGCSPRPPRQSLLLAPPRSPCCPVCNETAELLAMAAEEARAAPRIVYTAHYECYRGHKFHAFRRPAETTWNVYQIDRPKLSRAGGLFEIPLEEYKSVERSHAPAAGRPRLLSLIHI